MLKTYMYKNTNYTRKYFAYFQFGKILLFKRGEQSFYFVKIIPEMQKKQNDVTHSFLKRQRRTFQWYSKDWLAIAENFQ